MADALGSIPMMGVLGAFSSLWSGFAQSDAIQKKAQEEQRRAHLEHSQVLGTTRAVGASSGVEFSSVSLQNYLSTMDTEFRKQEQWALNAAQDQAGSILTASAFKAQSDIFKSAFDYGQASNWGR